MHLFTTEDAEDTEVNLVQAGAEMNESFLSTIKLKNGSSSNLVVISFLFQLSSSFLILLKVVDMFAS